MITTEHAQEALSRSYVHAIAAQAGVNYSLGQEFDYGFDGHFRPVKLRGNRRVESGYPVAFQLKCSTQWSMDESRVTYALKSKNYNDLVTRDPEAEGAILILMCLPERQGDWISVSEDEAIIRKCCYYMSLSGDPVPNENSTKTIYVPRANLLTGESLLTVLQEERIRRKGYFT